MLQITNELELKQLYDILIFQHVIKIYVKIITSTYHKQNGGNFMHFSQF